MKRFIMAAAITLASALPAAAQTAPPQFAQLLSLKTHAAQSMNAILTAHQRVRLAQIARLAHNDLRSSFDAVSAQDGPVQKIFTPAQLAGLAASLRAGTITGVDEDQMAKIAQFAGDMMMKASPAWQARSTQVDALLTPAQRTQIAGLRASTLARLPHISFMGFDLFSALGDGSPMGGFVTDPGSFALLLAVADLNYVSSSSGSP